MTYEIKIDEWQKKTQEPTGRIDTNNIAYQGDSAGNAADCYQAACVALRAGASVSVCGNYARIGVFFYTHGKVTDRYLIEKGRPLPKKDTK